MAFALLCPVPAEHLPDAEKMDGPVAFGSKRVEMFLKFGENRIPADTIVLLCARPAGIEPAVTHWARYIGWTPAEEGKHPDWQARPASTIKTDGSFWGFWEVRELQRLALPIALKALTSFKTKKPVSTTLRRPMFVAEPVI
jgi:hypothetical protein